MSETALFNNCDQVIKEVEEDEDNFTMNFKKAGML